MRFGIFNAPAPDDAGWEGRGDICDAVSFDYEKHFCGAGTFTLIIPRNSVYAEKIAVGVFLILMDGNPPYDGFIVKNILYDNDSLKITGYDLNGLLLDRVTLYPQENADKALKTGSTEGIVKYYVDYNCVSSTDAERNFPKLRIAENQDRGIANDAASPRLECVADVVADILGAQGMGYRITPDFNITGPGADLLIFEVYEAVDRTQNQSENDRVTFSFGLGNVTEMKRETGVTADKNTFYCELESGAVQRYYKDNKDTENTESSESETVSGYDRREEYLKLGCGLDELTVYAEHEIADRYGLTDSLEVTAGNPLDYGSIYNVGDIVTVYDRERRLTLESVISAAEIKRSATEYSVKLTLGESKPKLLDSYAKKGQATANSVRNTFGVGRPSPWDNTSEYFNRYPNGNVAGIEGQKNLFATARGYDTKALGYACSAEGANNSVEGDSSHIEGSRNTLSGKRNYSHHIEGQQNTLNVSNAIALHIEGYNNSYSGSGAASYMHVEGSTNKSGGAASHAEGQENTIKSSDYAHVQGFHNTVENSASANVEGQFNSVKASDYSDVGGFQNTVESAQSTHIRGMNNNTQGSGCASVGGLGNTVTDSGHASVMGQGNTAQNAVCSHICGMNNTVTGGTGNSISGNHNSVSGVSFATVGGMNCVIIGGIGSFAQGVGLDVSASEGVFTKAALGQYNKNEDDLIFAVGNGRSDDTRSNAFAVDSDGNIYITGDIYINGVKLDLGGNKS